MKKLLFTGFLMLLLLPLWSQPKPIQFEEYTLDNGLHVILHQDNTTPIVAITLLYHVGSKNESTERTGFAHFFEHLLFEGSENIERGNFDKLNENAGGVNNAYTTQDKTFYYQIFPSNQLELGLWMESERLLHAKIDEVGVETQREVVKEEKRSRYDNRPYGSFTIEMFHRAFEGHPYQWTPIGSMEHLNAATIDEFREFYKTFYVPQNATLSIAGDIDPKKTRELIEKYFGDIPQGTKEIPRPQPASVNRTEETRDVVYDNIQLPAIFYGYPMPAQGTEDYYALSMLTNVLSQGASSRLNKSVVDKQQKALQVAAFPFALEDAGLYILLGLANAGVDIEEVEEAINVEIEKVKNELITQQEFEKIRNQIESNFYSTNQNVSGIAESLADYHVFYGDANLINEEIKRYMKVTREDIQAVAKKYLDQNSRVALTYLPKSMEPEN